MALRKIITLPTGYTADYIKIAKYDHQKERKYSETIFSLWKDEATRHTPGAQPADPLAFRVRLEGAEFDEIFADGEYDETLIYNAVRSGLVKVDRFTGSDTKDTPPEQRMLYGAESVFSPGQGQVP
ncbi:MAG: hypothetical protein SFV32_12790 [Opitutaceae bacterium]|nr:hypothetical protein [Opitutaceae bacterium]